MKSYIVCRRNRVPLPDQEDEVKDDELEEARRRHVALKAKRAFQEDVSVTFVFFFNGTLYISKQTHVLINSLRFQSQLSQSSRSVSVDPIHVS